MQIIWVSEVTRLPRSVPIIDGMLTFLFIGGTRFGLRAAEEFRARRSNEDAEQARADRRGRRRGEMVVREMRTSHFVSLEPVGFVDDNPYKQGVAIHGVPVLGHLANIPELVEKYQIQEVIIAMPAAPGDAIRHIIRLCEKAGVPSTISARRLRITGWQGQYQPVP